MSAETKSERWKRLEQLSGLMALWETWCMFRWKDPDYVDKLEIRIDRLKHELAVV
jgi:hypothetical protein